jgi:WD40 repeat protein
MSWTTVRIFISSTFLDMQAERDHLVRVVFPKLRRDLARERIHIVDIDLRWGVRSEEDAYDACMEVIGMCSVVVVLLGGRYGWIPQGRSLSITDLEVRNVLKQPNDAHILIYARNRTAALDVPDDLRTSYYEAHGSSSQEKLADLYSFIESSGHQPQVYQARWDPSTGHFSSLQDFGNRVYRDLLFILRSRFAGADADESQQLVEQFIENRSEGYVIGNRARVLSDLQSFCTSNEGAGIACVIGEPGSGKSAFLANLCRLLQRAGSAEICVVPVFVGVTPHDADATGLMQSLLRGLGVNTLPATTEELRAALKSAIEEAASSKKVILVIDAIDQVRSSRWRNLRWLPTELPDNARLIVSTTPTSATFPAMRALVPELVEKELGPLETSAAREIIDRFLHRYRKRFEEDQLAALLCKEHADRPLYLLTALEELRTLGTYEEISKRILQLPERTEDLFDWILARLESDHTLQDGPADHGDTVPAFFRYIAASRNGLAMDELVDLPGLSTAEEQVAAIERLARPYLMFRAGLLTFFHAELRRAVEARYMDREAAIYQAHQNLAAYFYNEGNRDCAGWACATERPLREHLFHLLQLRDFAALDGLFESLPFLEHYCRRVDADSDSREYVGVSSLLLYMREAISLGRTSALCGQDRMRRWAALSRLVGKSARLLQQVPGALATQIASSQSVSTSLIAAAASHRGISYNYILGARQHSPASHVTSLAIQDDGTVAVGSMNGFVTMWSVNESAALWSIGGHSSWVTSIAFSLNGQRLLTCGDDGSTSLWDTETGGMEVLDWVFDSGLIWRPVDLCFSADQNRAWLVSGPFARLIDVEAELVVEATRRAAAPGLRGPGEGPKVAVGGGLIATITGRQEFAVHELSSGTIIRSGDFQTTEPRFVALSADGQTLLYSDAQGRVFLEDVRSGELTQKRLSHVLRAVCSNRDGFLCVDLLNRLYRIAPTAGTTPQRLQFDPELNESDHVTSMGLSPNGMLLAIGHSSGACAVYEVDTGLRRWFAPSGVSVGRGAVIDKGKRAMILNGERAAGEQLPVLEGISLVDKQRIYQLGSPHRGLVSAICAIGEKRTVSVDHEGTVVIWKDGRPVKTTQHHGMGFSACANWEEGGTYVAATLDERVLVGRRRREVVTLHCNKLEYRAGISAVAAAGQPLSLFAAYFNGLVRFDGNNSGWTGRLDSRHHLRCTAAALDSNCRFAASGNLNGEAQIWSCADGSKLLDSRLHYGEVTALYIDEKRLISAGADAFLYVIDVAKGSITDGCVFPHYAVSLSSDPDGCLFALLSNGSTVTITLQGGVHIPKRRSLWQWLAG